MIVKTELDKILSSIPNIPIKDVPVGKNEDANIEIEKKGNILKPYLFGIDTQCYVLELEKVEKCRNTDFC